MQWSMIEGEVGVLWTARLKRTDTGEDFDLTGATVTLLIGSQASRSMTVTDATTGQCRYTTVSGDNATDGTGLTVATAKGKDGRYFARIKVVSGSNTYYTTETVKITVTGAVAVE